MPSAVALGAALLSVTMGSGEFVTVTKYPDPAVTGQNARQARTPHSPVLLDWVNKAPSLPPVKFRSLA